MPDKEVLVVQTGVANTASVLSGLKRAGAVPRLSNEPDQIASSEKVVLPGVGAFDAALEQLRKGQLTEALTERIQKGLSTLCVCVGFQLLFEQSEESPKIRGLCILPGKVEKFPESVSVPQFGWNYVTADKDCRFLESGFAYFANSFRVVNLPPKCTGGTCVHGGPFVAALETKGLLACQFHPELSGSWGISLLTRWVNQQGSLS